LAIVSNSIKDVIVYVLKEANVYSFFSLVKGGVKGQNKVQRIEKVMEELDIHHLLFLDDKEVNLQDVSFIDGVHTLHVTYDELVSQTVL
jgi:hypothetical protein